MIELAKRLLLDHTCHNCEYNYKRDPQYCENGHEGCDSLIPDEKTCENWKKRKK